MKIVIQGRDIKKYVLPDINSLTMGTFDFGVFDCTIVDEYWATCVENGIDFYIDSGDIDLCLITEESSPHKDSYHVQDIGDFCSNVYAFALSAGFEINTSKIVDRNLDFTFDNIKSSLLKYGIDYETYTTYSVIDLLMQITLKSPVFFKYGDTQIPIIGYSLAEGKVSLKSLYEDIYFDVDSSNFPADILYVISTPNDYTLGDEDTVPGDMVTYDEMTLSEKQDMYAQIIIKKLKSIRFDMNVLFDMLKDFPEAE